MRISLYNEWLNFELCLTRRLKKLAAVKRCRQLKREVPEKSLKNEFPQILAYKRLSLGNLVPVLLSDLGYQAESHGNATQGNHF
jgi:hypothetical protein